MKCDICKMRFNPDKIIPINVSGSDGTGNIVSMPVYSIQFNGRDLKLCQRCLAMTLWVESQRGMWVEGAQTVRFDFGDPVPVKQEIEEETPEDINRDGE